ncbi:hypothetical protein [Pseudorhodobacter ferrugineus]|uniref:hypothetical protein n=1 Tax=Pseudorhodobacter ferrugineus TaxID=77008 RepID=UPI0003B418CB|nr:hypothetical protein [Pseudorhodobacter ferrugineus]
MGKKLSDFEPLWEAEKRLVAWLQAGNREPFRVSDSVPPEDAPKALRIRAEFVRYLALGGCKKCAPSEKGLGVEGAYIEGDEREGAETRGLDLEGCTLTGDFVMFDCRFPEPVFLRVAQLQNLFFNGSALMHGMVADGLEARGVVVLDGITVQGELRFLGAKVGGYFDCEDAKLNAGDADDALNLDGLAVRGDLILRGIEARGAVRLVGARVGGLLACGDASLQATRHGNALNCNRAEISGGFLLAGETMIVGALDLTGAQIGQFNDQEVCWPTEILLDRCRYGAFVGQAPVDAAARLRWLGLQRPEEYGVAFWPQPYEECARALREAGHGGAARTILIEKERLQRAARRKELRAESRTGQAGLLAVWDGILGATVRYGRAPLLAFAWLVGFWLAGVLVFGGAETFGAIKPNLPQVQRAPEWVLCGVTAGEAVRLPSLGKDAVGLRQPLQTQYDCYLGQHEALSYPQFNAWVYSADVLLPVVSLEMQSYWLPNGQSPFGVFARWYLWVQIIAGWALTLLAVAGFSGLIKQDSK